MRELLFKIKNFFANVKNVFRWLPIIWKDRDYDWAYILIILQFKLKNLKERYESEELYVGQERDAEWLNVCIKLIEIIINGESYDGYINVNKMPFYKKLKENNSFASYYATDAYGEKCRHLLFKILAWRMPYWWD